MSPRAYRRGFTPDVRSFVHEAKIELIPIKGYETKLAEIPLGTTVTITCSPRFGLERTFSATEFAAAAGYQVVPHLAARQVVDDAQLKELLGRLDAAGVHELYVIGGDATEPAGGYASAAALLETLGEVDHSLTRIGVACYPEGHPSIREEELMAALLAKQPMADYMVSQMCFDAGVLLRWLREVRAAGVTLPLHVGLAAPMQTRKLAELSLKIGVGPSLRFVTKQHGLWAKLLRGQPFQPERLLAGMGDELRSSELDIQRLHMFSFNQVAATVAWQQRLAGTERAAISER